jgi:uncharacterized peroxidase-related enzyme
MGAHSAWHHARMPLIDPLPSDASPEVAELAQLFNQTLGFVPNSVLTMMRRPAIARAFTALNKAVMANEGRVSSELKRLIGHIASSAAGCRYCEAHTIRAAERYGGTPERLAAVWDFRASPLFSPPERAALEFALAAAQQPGSVDETIGGELRRHWDDGEIVEIAGVVALFGFLNRWNDAMGTTLEPAATADGEKHLARRGWSPGKHCGGPGADTR